MTLLELCEPLFLYVCRLNRSARKGGTHEFNRVRGEVDAILEQMKARAAAEPRLVGQYPKIERVLIFFVDSMISESKLAFARDWHRNRKAFQLDELAGDDRFWELLDETLQENTPEATERLAVFYTCIGLGFTGFYAGQPEYLRTKMMQIAARIQYAVDTDIDTRICPDAYENVNTSDLVEPPAVKLVGIAIGLVGLIIVLFVSNIFLFRWTSDQLVAALRQVVAHEQATAAPDAKGPDSASKATEATQK
ncbi:MAG TPA: DotU family type IV/VI secretion system protein [Planctomycetota bacterium]|nr:DotU family type IV/VI secretion system protein [Planctomycetota bacterium]